MENVTTTKRFKKVYKTEPAYKDIRAIKRWYLGLPRKKKKAARARFQELLKERQARHELLMSCFY